MDTGLREAGKRLFLDCRSEDADVWFLISTELARRETSGMDRFKRNRSASDGTKTALESLIGPS